MNKFFIKAGSIGAMLGVALGAFGAHALKAFLVLNQRTETFETAVKYLFYHSLALILVGILFKEFNNTKMKYAGYSFLIGLIIFPGSLFLLVGTGAGMLGAITPLGGVAFIAGWLFLFLSVSKS